MPEQIFVVRPNRLNFRRGPGLEAIIIARLGRGSSVVLLEGGNTDVWWKVRPDGTQAAGYVARRYLTLVSSTSAIDLVGANDVLWDATQQAIDKGVRYNLGDKDSNTGRIDCSGWVAEITIKAFSAINAAARPEVVFDKYDNRILRNHSDAIVTGLTAHTGYGLRGDQIIENGLRDGMLIGINFATYNWEDNDPPRKFGIDHIVQVVSDPVSGKKHITQSSASGNGVNLQPLDVWLDARRTAGLIGNGRIHAVDPFLLADPNTGYAQRPASIMAPRPTPASPVTGGPHPAFSGRGMYVYTVAGLLHTFGTLDSCIREMQRCHLNHIWVRIHGRGYVGDERGASKDRLKALISGARQAGIAVAGWGWCQGENPAAEAQLAADALAAFELDDYIADIEQGVNGAKWTASEVLQFITTVRGQMNVSAGLGLSSHGFIEYQEPKIFTQAVKQVDYLNPQAYWFEDKPNAKMLKFIKVDNKIYPLHSPAAYARLCYDRWTKLYNRPVVLTGQAAAEGDLTATDAEKQLKRFLADFEPSPGLVGVNFWHWGATTKAMRDALAAAPCF